MLQNLPNNFQKAPYLQPIHLLLQNKYSKINLDGVIGSAVSFVIDSIFKMEKLPILMIFPDKEWAAYTQNDLEILLGKNDVLFYPSSYRRPYQLEETDNANVLLRAEVLNRINSRKKPAIIVTYTEAIFEKVVTKNVLDKNTFKITVNDTISLDFLNEVLFEYEFKRVDFVTEPGEFSVRGGIVDVFSFAHDQPYRIEFFGNEVESIRTFNLETQLSIENCKKIEILPNLESKFIEEKRQSFLEFIPQNTLIVTQKTKIIQEQLNHFFEKANSSYQNLSKEIKHLSPEELFINGTLFLQQLELFSVIELNGQNIFNTKNIFKLNMQPQPSFNKQFELLFGALNDYQNKGYQNFLLCSNASQVARFHDIFNSLYQNQDNQQYKALEAPFSEGFIDHDLQICAFTDHQIFERYHKFHLKNGFKKNQTISLKEINSLNVGDYVTHIDHGIGKFGGLQKIKVEDKTQEAIKLIYAENDIVYVSIHSLHKIAKFNGKDGIAPKIHKVGSQAWKALKQKTKVRVKEIAFNLIQLYAKRRLEKGFAYDPDSYLQHELESSFIYEDTPDQLKATQDVKADMEQEKPMDRLVCGDVGFGKTEIAIRAAFKAVDNGKQVAVLVPTTILAYQHYRTFSKRMKDLPVNIDYLNRFRTAKQKTEILKNLENGKLDILIGTHQLVSKNVKFKNLGLLIIDEEQKFGVNVKDKLKTIAHNIDTLTLTATPIPRTLQFSLMAARDLTVISTPPPNRVPIDSQVITFSETIIRDAISYELQRGGQVFFINNRIENIKEVAGMLQRLIPDAKIGIGHGQMEGKKLEELMLGFIEGDFDILVATSIIENGLDVPNANTIFINNAHQFGLSDLHQMRGRVGRSNKKAFCYFITPGYTTMTEEARKRMQALETFKDLGSGFHIAMKDLEIRGAGDILGGEQSGFINEIGFETYQKIMNEAIEELKENEFKELYENQEKTEKVYVKEFSIDTDIELLFPDFYINNITERLNIYTELSQVKNDIELQIFKQKLLDRFGKLPKTSENLLQSVKLKWKAIHIGLEKIILKQHKMVGYFIADQQSSFYQTPQFTNILKFAQNNPMLCKLQEKQTKNGLKLLISFENVKTIEKSLELLEKIHL
ncbi:MAG: transcription-repair coupling factor [Flavobacterium sp.]